MIDDDHHPTSQPTNPPPRHDRHAQSRLSTHLLKHVGVLFDLPLCFAPFPFSSCDDLMTTPRTSFAFLRPVIIIILCMPPLWPPFL